MEITNSATGVLGEAIELTQMRTICCYHRALASRIRIESEVSIAQIVQWQMFLLSTLGSCFPKFLPLAS